MNFLLFPHSNKGRWSSFSFPVHTSPPKLLRAQNFLRAYMSVMPVSVVVQPSVASVVVVVIPSGENSFARGAAVVIGHFALDVQSSGFQRSDVQTCSWSNWQPDPLVQSAVTSAAVQSRAPAAWQMFNASVIVFRQLQVGTSDSAQGQALFLLIHPFFCVSEQHRTSCVSAVWACCCRGGFLFRHCPCDDPPTTVYPQPGIEVNSQ